MEKARSASSKGYMLDVRGEDGQTLYTIHRIHWVSSYRDLEAWEKISPNHEVCAILVGPRGVVITERSKACEGSVLFAKEN